MIRQKNGADTLYALHTSRSSGDLLLTNEELPRVASRRREVTDVLQKPFMGLIYLGIFSGMYWRQMTRTTAA